MAKKFKPINGSWQYPLMDYFLLDNPDMDIRQTIAGNLTSWMKGHPRFSTIKPLADASGVGFGTIQRVKNGEGNPTVANLEAIAKAFRRSAIDLMTDQSYTPCQVETLNLKACEPNKEDQELIEGFHFAPPDDRETMLFLARRATQKRDFSARSESQ